MAWLKRDDFAVDCGSAATQFRCRLWIGSDAVPLPILDRQRPSFAADSLIGSDGVSAADFRIGSDAAIAMESGWIAGTNKRLVSVNGI